MSEVVVPSRQEMFNRAWNGLKSQGFTRCRQEGNSMDPSCMYDDGQGHHCAWGWVDPEGTATMDGYFLSGTVRNLADRGIGLAARLSYEDQGFAVELQVAHDNSPTPEEMQTELRRIASKYHLAVPGDVAIQVSTANFGGGEVAQ